MCCFLDYKFFCLVSLDVPSRLCVWGFYGAPVNVCALVIFDLCPAPLNLTLASNPSVNERAGMVFLQPHRKCYCVGVWWKGTVVILCRFVDFWWLTNVT